MTVLRSLETGSLPQAFRAYVSLIEYIKSIHQASDSAKAAASNGVTGIVALTSHLVGMANSVWSSLVRVLSRCASMRDLGFLPLLTSLAEQSPPQQARIARLAATVCRTSRPVRGPSSCRVPDRLCRLAYA